MGRKASNHGSSRTLVARLFEDGHGHHDGRRRRVECAGGAGLLQRRDGAAVLRWDIGVGAGARGAHHPLQGLSCNQHSVTISLSTDCRAESMSSLMSE